MIAKQIMKLALVDDHRLFRKGLISLIDWVCKECIISMEADNGLDLQQKLTGDNAPDILLLDVNMPRMDGFATVKWLSTNYPAIKIIVVTMVEQEETIARMYNLGVKAYLSKSVEPTQFYHVLKNVFESGKRFYYTNRETQQLSHKPAKQ